MNISIGIPIYNDKNNIINLIESFIEQIQDGYRIDKIYIYNDGSTDGTKEILDAFIKDHKKGILIEHNYQSINKGKSVGLNNIFKNVDSDLLIIVDSDIVIEDTNFLKKFVNLHKSNPQMGLSSAQYMPQKSKYLISKVYEFSTQISIELGKYKPLYNCIGAVMCLTKSVYKNIELQPDSYRTDAFLYLKTLGLGFQYSLLDNAIVKDPVDYSKLNFKKYIKIQKRVMNFPESVTKNVDTAIFEKETALSIIILVKSFLKASIKKPLSTIVYLYYKLSAKAYITLTNSLVINGRWRD